MRKQVFVRVSCFVLLLITLGIWGWSYVALITVGPLSLRAEVNWGEVQIAYQPHLVGAVPAWFSQSPTRPDGFGMQFGGDEIFGIKWGFGRRTPWSALQFSLWIPSLFFGLLAFGSWGKFRNIRAFFPRIKFRRLYFKSILQSKIRPSFALGMASFGLFTAIVAFCVYSTWTSQIWEREYVAGDDGPYDRTWIGTYAGLLCVVTDHMDRPYLIDSPERYLEYMNSYDLHRIFYDPPEWAAAREDWLGFSLQKYTYVGRDHPADRNSVYYLIPLWWPLVLFGMMPAFALVKAYKKRLVNGYVKECQWQQVCSKCEYDLRAHRPGGKCPECGTEITQLSGRG